MQDSRGSECERLGGAGRVREGFLGEAALNQSKWQLRRSERTLDSHGDRQGELEKAARVTAAQQKAGGGA